MLFPSTAGWWLDYYDDFARSLGEGARLDVCTIFDLAGTHAHA
jgi:hypothetical protein